MECCTSFIYFLVEWLFDGNANTLTNRKNHVINVLAGWTPPADSGFIEVGTNTVIGIDDTNESLMVKDNLVKDAAGPAKKIWTVINLDGRYRFSIDAQSSTFSLYAESESGPLSVKGTFLINLALCQNDFN